MTFEEIQQAIEGLLSVQRELQNSQLRFESEMADVKEAQKQTGVALGSLLEVAQSSERKIERLIGYSITQESDVLDVKTDILDLKRRIAALERNQ